MGSEGIPSTTFTFPARCLKHDTPMFLSIYDRPGGPQGNGWVCAECAKETEVLSPAMHPHDVRYYEISEEDNELHHKKSADYGNGEDPFANVLGSGEWGVEPWIGIMVRVEDKMRRLKSLIRNGKLMNESAIDSLRDIRCYTQMAQVLFEESQKKPDTTTNLDPLKFSWPENYRSGAISASLHNA